MFEVDGHSLTGSNDDVGGAAGEPFVLGFNPVVGFGKGWFDLRVCIVEAEDHLAVVHRCVLGVDDDATGVAQCQRTVWVRGESQDDFASGRFREFLETDAFLLFLALKRFGVRRGEGCTGCFDAFTRCELVGGCDLGFDEFLEVARSASQVGAFSEESAENRTCLSDTAVFDSILQGVLAHGGDGVSIPILCIRHQYQRLTREMRHLTLM